MKKGNEMQTWTAVGLAGELDVPWRTMMRWLRQFRAIQGVKVKGKARRVFDKTDAALCITARRGLEQGLPVPAVNYLLEELRVPFEWSFLEPDQQKVREFKESSWLVALIPDSVRRTLNRRRETNPEAYVFADDEPVIIGSCAQPKPTDFPELVNQVRETTSWKFVLISIASIFRELEGRLDATAHHRDYKEISLAGEQTLALALLGQKILN